MKSQDFVDTDVISQERATGAAKSASGAQGRAEIDVRVEQARQQMLELRRQQDDLERQRQELEELRRREEEFEKGKAEMLEELARTVTHIEQEEFEINKRSTALGSFRESYQDLIRQLQGIHENEWSGDELKTQLNKAAAVVETAKAELNKGRAQLEFLGDGPVKFESDLFAPPGGTSAPSSFDFKMEFMRGLARSLPLIVALLIALVLLLGKGK